MKRIISSLLLTFFIFSIYAQTDFLAEQKKYKRVRAAISEKEQLVINNLKKDSIELNEVNIMIIAYKDESEVEIFAKRACDVHILLVALSFLICCSLLCKAKR